MVDKFCRGIRFSRFLMGSCDVLQGAKQGKLALAEAQVARASEVGVSDTFFTVKTHLGNVLHPGDTALGYDLVTANLQDADLDGFKVTTHMPALLLCSPGYVYGLYIFDFDLVCVCVFLSISVGQGAAGLPEVVLVRKSYPPKSRTKRRKWALKTLEKDTEDTSRRKGQHDQEMRDFEEFQRELEEDPELRANVNVYRRPKAAGDVSAAMSEVDPSERPPEIPLDELLDGLTLGAATSVALNVDRALALAQVS
jgi:nonsense-mediated mRNA decay protein 3